MRFIVLGLMLLIVGTLNLRAADGERMTVTLREEQSGIAGKQVWVWEIQPSGVWRMLSFRVNLEGQEVVESRQEATGRVNAKRRQELMTLCSQQPLAVLPARLGKESNVNAHRYLLTVGVHQTIVEGVAPRRGGSVRENILQAAPKNDLQAANPFARFADLAHAVCQGCQ